MRAFRSYYFQSFIRPRKTLDELVTDPRRLRFGAYALAVNLVVYTLVYFFLSRNGGRPTTFKPWLAIDPEVYYRYNLVMCAPSMVLAWVASGGFVQLFARALGGRGAFEDTLAVFGFGIGVASWATGLHDVVTAFLGWIRVLDQRTYEDALSTPSPFFYMLWALMILYLGWFVAMFTLGIRAAHRARWLPSLLGGVLGFVVYQGVFVIFNR